VTTPGPTAGALTLRPVLAGLAGWRAHALAAAAGALATVAHAPFHVFPAFVAAVTVLILLIDAAPKARWAKAVFARVWWFGAGHLISGLHWVSSAFLVDPDTFGIGMGVAAAIALGGGLALFWAVAMAMCKPFWTQDYRRIFVFALAISLAELARGHLFGGFPWLLAAYVWAPGGAISQIAAVVGAYGLTTLTLLAAASPAAALDEGRAMRRFGLMMALALGFGLLWGFGFQRLNQATIAVPGSTPVVRVADAGLSQAEKWNANPDEVLLEYLEVSGSAEDSRADFVIWPEGAIPNTSYTLADRLEVGGRDYVLEPVRSQLIAEVMGDRVLITGATACAPAELCRAMYRGERRDAEGRVSTAGLTFSNSALAIDAVTGSPRPAGLYDKHRLTPFGEFIPLWDLFSGLNIAPLQQIGAGFAPGPAPQRLVVDAGAEPLVVHICYESIFPGFTPRGEGRPGWIVNVTNDAWFGGGVGPAQHFAIARYRSIEEGLPMARAASGGASAIIDAYGRAISVADRTVGFAEAQLPATLPPTIFARYGWFALAALLALLAGLRVYAPRLAPRESLT
jgi:apolipoprotein N-acyltransferase